MQLPDRINILVSELLDVEQSTAESFDNIRKNRLKKSNNTEGKKEIFTSGVLIERIRPENAHICYKDKGKPFFVDNMGKPCTPYFNITHSNNKVICVYSEHYIVGADYEPVSRVMKPETARRLCTPKEYEVFWAFEDRVYAGRWLLKLFTQKEAYSKLSGAGMSLDFTEIDIEEVSVKLVTIEMEDGYLSIAYTKA